MRGICRSCRSRTADSREHLFQSAIGGRREVHGVLCKPCNDRFGTTIDSALTEDFAGIRMVLAIEGDRGQTASVEATDNAGKKVILRPGALVDPAPGKPTLVETDGTTTRWISASPGQARDLVRAAARKRPGVPVTVTRATLVRSFPKPVNLEMSVGGEDFFRCAMKTALVLLARAELEGEDGSLSNAWRYVSGASPAECSVRAQLTAAPAPWVDDALGPVPHRVVVIGNADHGFVAADVRYFGEYAACIRIDAPVRNNFGIAYGVDPFSGAERERANVTACVAIPGLADPDALCRQIERATMNVQAAATARQNGALAKSIAERCLKRILGSVRDPKDDAEFQAVTRCVADELAFIMLGVDDEQDDPGLLADLSALAESLVPSQKAGGSSTLDRSGDQGAKPDPSK